MTEITKVSHETSHRTFHQKALCKPTFKNTSIEVESITSVTWQISTLVSLEITI